MPPIADLQGVVKKSTAGDFACSDLALQMATRLDQLRRRVGSVTTSLNTLSNRMEALHAVVGRHEVEDPVSSGSDMDTQSGSTDTPSLS